MKLFKKRGLSSQILASKLLKQVLSRSVREFRSFQAKGSSKDKRYALIGEFLSNKNVIGND
jgi:hypothetical protein